MQSGASHSVVASKCIRQMPNKYADLRQHGLCLSINCHSRWRSGAFPVGKNAHKLARPEFFLNVPANHSDNAASSNAGFAKSINTLDHQFWRESYSLSSVRPGELPFVVDVAFKRHMSNAGMLEQVSWLLGSARAIEIIGRCAYYVSGLDKLAHDKALRFWMLPASLSQATSAHEDMDALVTNLCCIIDT